MNEAETSDANIFAKWCKYFCWLGDLAQLIPDAWPAEIEALVWLANEVSTFYIFIW